MTTSYFFKALYGFAVSPNTVRNGRKALKNLAKGTYIPVPRIMPEPLQEVLQRPELAVILCRAEPGMPLNI